MLSLDGPLIHHDLHTWRASNLQKLGDGRGDFGRESSTACHQCVEEPMEVARRSHLKGVRVMLHDEKVETKVDKVVDRLAGARV